MKHIFVSVDPYNLKWNIKKYIDENMSFCIVLSKRKSASDRDTAEPLYNEVHII